MLLHYFIQLLIEIPKFLSSVSIVLFKKSIVHIWLEVTVLGIWLGRYLEDVHLLAHPDWAKQPI